LKNKYIDLINQTFHFPQESFALDENYGLKFHDINLNELINKHGTPLKFTYLPKISSQIQQAKSWFDSAMKKVDYQGEYHYCYCTKSNHFKHTLKTVLKNDTHIETSSGFDIDIVRNLNAEGFLKKDRFIVCNGFKLDTYLDKIAGLMNDGYENVIPVIDNFPELERLEQRVEGTIKIGLRIAAEEEPKFAFYTSRLGIGYKYILPYYKERISNNPKTQLKMLHFFINTGIEDDAYYWNELHKCLKVYCELKKINPYLDSLNIGGGFPIKNSLSFDYDYQYMIDEIVNQIKMVCKSNDVPEPNLFTEFGSYTVGEAGGMIYEVKAQKAQNDREKWNMIDSSFMTTLPDSWAINKKFIMLAVNRWNDTYERVLLGGITCDSDDYYNSEQHSNAIFLPYYNDEKPLYIGFFHTAAYQDSLGGFGGIHHCLTPAPKHLVLDRDEDGQLQVEEFAGEQQAKQMLSILGY